MAVCSRCGREFDLSFARRSIGRKYGAGQYDDSFEDGDVCDLCASEEIGAYMSAGAEIIELMGSGWDPD